MSRLHLITELWVDGGCNSNTLPNAWGSVVCLFKDKIIDILFKEDKKLSDFDIKEKFLGTLGSRNIIISNFSDVKTQQNNGAELLALVAGLKIAKRIKSIKIIYSDSSLVVDYWSKGKIGPSVKDSRKKIYITECGKLRKEFEKNGGKIIKISGDNNKADLGKHK